MTPLWFQYLILLFVGAVGTWLFLMPSIEAHKRKHPNKQAILALNLLLGWTFLGWVCALIWAYTKKNPPEN